MRFGLFFLAEYLSVFGVSCLGTVLFLGGGGLPFVPYPKVLLSDTTASIVLVNVFTMLVFAAKVALYVFLMFWVRATLPRLRVDQLMNFAWKAMVPLSIVNIVIAAVWYELGGVRRTELWLWGWLVTFVLVVVAVWAVFRMNQGLRRVPGAREPGRPAPVLAAAATR
jgi:NADH-quinone oxidoreductase subunit H